MIKIDLRLEVAKAEKPKPWVIDDLENAIKSLKSGKCRDPEGIIREVFMDECMGEDLKQSLLILCNKIKEERKFPDFMQKTNICAIYKGCGDVLTVLLASKDAESPSNLFMSTPQIL